MILLGMFQMAWGQGTTEGLEQYQIISVLAVSGVVLGAWYMLWMIQRVFFGPLHEPKESEDTEIKDLSGREVMALAPLAILVVWIGIQPGFFLKRMGPSLDSLTTPARVLWEENQLTNRQEPVINQVSADGIADRETSARVR
jgi:NADH-quinone oxidoreductase subunit M